MENNVVSFIAENIFLFLPLVITGIVVTLYLYITGSRDVTEIKDDLDADYIILSKFNVNVYVLIYLFIFIMMIIMGFLSDFIIPVIVGGILAFIPIIVIILVNLGNAHLKER